MSRTKGTNDYFNYPVFAPFDCHICFPCCWFWSVINTEIAFATQPACSTLCSELSLHSNRGQGCKEVIDLDWSLQTRGTAHALYCFANSIKPRVGFFFNTVINLGVRHTHTHTNMQIREQLPQRKVWAAARLLNCNPFCSLGVWVSSSAEVLGGGICCLGPCLCMSLRARHTCINESGPRRPFVCAGVLC